MKYTQKVLNRKLNFLNTDPSAQEMLELSKSDVMIYTAIQMYLEDNKMKWQDCLSYLVIKYSRFNSQLLNELRKKGSTIDIKISYNKEDTIQ